MRHGLLEARKSVFGSVFARMFTSTRTQHSPSSTRLPSLPLDGTDPRVGGHRPVLCAISSFAGGLL